MDDARFEQMVARLERESVEAPRAYQVKVALLALLGLGVLALIVGTAGLGLFLLAGLLLAVLLSGGKAIFLLVKFGKLLLLLAIPLWLLVSSSIKALMARLPAPDGRALSRGEAPALFAAIDDMRKRMKGPRFHHVLLVDEMNAAVVQLPLLGLIGWPRNYLLLGLPLLESMSPDEAIAVVAHEYGHLAGSHGRFAAFIYRLRLSWGSIQVLAGQWQGWGGRIMRRLVGWYAPYFNAYTFVLARANEFEADRASADLVGAPITARALKRVNLAALRHEDFLQKTFACAADLPQPPQDLAQRWGAASAVEPDDAQAKDWLQQALNRRAHPQDTHPGLSARLQALAGDGAKLNELPPPHHGASAAQAWLGDSLSMLRREFETAWSDRVERPWQERHQELAQQRQELAQLEALETPDQDQRFRRIRLQTQLRPDFDAAAAYAAFNAEHPEHSAGLFFEGVSRLERRDDAGLALLERAMTLAPEVTLPACEQAYHYLNMQGDERARSYATRWQARQDFEQRRAAQLEHLDPSHPLASPELPAEALAQVRTLLEPHRSQLARADLTRRILPIDTTLNTYVLLLQPTWWARLRRRQYKIVDQLAQQDWPMHVIIVTLEGRFKRLRRPLKRLAGTRVA